MRVLTIPLVLIAVGLCGPMAMDLPPPAERAVIKAATAADDLQAQAKAVLDQLLEKQQRRMAAASDSVR